MRQYLDNTENIMLAVDPGLSGAVATVGCGRIEVARDFRTLRDISEGIARLSKLATGAVIEKVHAMPGQGVCSMFSFGRSTGVAFGSLFSHNLVPHEVTPQRWQNWFREKCGLDRVKYPKFDSRALAAQLFPEYAYLLKRKLDHGTADAVLIAVWRLANLELV